MGQQVPSDQAEKKSIQISLLAMASYLFALCVLPLIFNKKNKFVMYHAKQGLALFSIEVSVILLSIIPLFGNYLSPVLLAACFFTSAWGIFTVFQNKTSPILFVSDIAGKIHL